METVPDFMGDSNRTWHSERRDMLRTFFGALFDKAPDTLFRQCFTLPAKRTIYMQVVDEALIEDLIRRCDGGQDVYVGVGLAPKNYGEWHRCPAHEVVGLVGLWADVDVCHPVHKKTNLPPTVEDAQAVLAEMGPKPTVVIHSGHGLQAWWLFREPWLFQDDADRAKAASLAKRWGVTLQAKAAAHGWAVDSVHDLSRLMRLPGLLNWKELRGTC